jgi:hypothetical protein
MSCVVGLVYTYKLVKISDRSVPPESADKDESKFGSQALVTYSGKRSSLVAERRERRCVQQSSSDWSKTQYSFPNLVRQRGRKGLSFMMGLFTD